MLALLTALALQSGSAIVPLADINQVGYGLGSSIEPQPAGWQLAWGEAPELVAAGGRWFFTASEGAGAQLFVTDGTTAGTQALTSLPSGLDFEPRELVELGGRLYFTANDGVHGLELWTSDGTVAGTHLAVDLIAGAAGSAPSDFAALGGMLLFQAADATGDRELWRTDGTPAGTVQVANLEAAASSSPHAFGLDASGTQLYFAAKTAVSGVELWKTNGTAAGTGLVADLLPGTSDSLPRFFTSVGGRTVFVAHGSVPGEQVWSTDGTAAGTFELTGLENVGGLEDLRAAELGGHLYVIGRTSNQHQIWKTDGTLAGTQVVFDQAVTGIRPEHIVEMGGLLYFTAPGGIYSFDGSTALVVHDLASINNAPSAKPVASGSRLFFVGEDAVLQQKTLFASDGATLTSVMSNGANPIFTSGAPSLLTPDGTGGLLFKGYTEETGPELFATPGAAPATLVKDINPLEKTESSDPRYVRSFDGQRLYFAANDGVQGRDPWTWSPSGGAEKLADISGTGTFLVLGQAVDGWAGGAGLTLLYDAYSAPIVTDGTPAGTGVLAVPGKSFKSSDTRSAISDGAALYFVAEVQDLTTFQTTSTLWRTQGTGATTWAVGAPEVFTAFAPRGALPGQAFAMGREAATGYELYVTGGTPNSATLLLDIFPGPGDSLPVGWAVLGDQAYFTATDPVNGRTVWRTDGTPAGTVPFVDVNSTSDDPEDFDLWSFEGALWINAFGADGLKHLWSADAQGVLTDLGAIDVFDLDVGLGQHDGRVVSAGGETYISGSDAANDWNLYRTDGTVAGTQVVSLPPGVSMGGELLVANGGVYFTAIVPPGTLQLYFTDGATTFEVPTGLHGSGKNPADLTLVDGSLVFTADSLLVGRELMILPNAGASAKALPGGAPGGARLAVSTPKLGIPIAIEAKGWPAGHLVALFTSLPAAGPSQLLTDPLHASWLDPLSIHLWTLSANPTLQLSLTLPADPNLAGLQVTAQVFHGPALGQPAFTSNALLVTFGE